MKKLILISILLLCMLFSLFSATEQGSYVRKSITALDSVLVFPQAQSMVYHSWAFDLDRFNTFLTYYIEMPRFDYNVIPEQLKRTFTSRINAMYDLNPLALAGLLESTVVDEIIAILNDPEIQRARFENFRDEAALQSFAATKAKALGFTETELLTLFNSAYIYLPFISAAYIERSQDGSDTIYIEGGIIWWKIDVDETGKTAIQQLLVAPTWSMGFVDYNRSDYIFSFDGESWAAGPIEYAVNDAMLAFAKNLSVKTRSIDDFKLQAQIVESKGTIFGFPLGRNEGVHLDDGFYIVGFKEDANGETVSFKKGYARVSKTGNNIADATALSYARQIMGSRGTIGDVVMEHPRLGIELAMSAGLTTGSVIKPAHTEITTTWPSASATYRGLNESVSSQLTFTTSLLYNMAPIVNFSQCYLNIDVGLSLPLVGTGSDASMMVVSPYLGITKGFGGRLYLQATAAIGVDSLNITYQRSTMDFTIDHRALGAKASVEAGYMITPNWRLALFGSYKLALPPFITTTKIEGGYGYASDDASDMRLGGTTIGIGLTYSLGELPINLVGFLDPLKQY